MCYRGGYDSAHPISRCPYEHSRKAERERALVQREIRFLGMHVCFRYSLPRIICDRWSEDGRAKASDEDGKEREYQFHGVLIGVIYGMKHAYVDA